MIDPEELDIIEEEHDCDPNTDKDDLNHRHDAEGNEEPFVSDDD